MAQDSMRTGSAGHGHRRLALSPSMRKIVLTAHIIVSVELLGDSAAFLAVAIRAATMVDPLIAHASYELLRMFSNVFGIPLSFAAPLIGLLLGIGTKWGVFRHGWVVIKLLLIVSVMLVGGLVFDGGIDATLSGDGGAEGRLIAGAAYDVVALTVATALSVFKPRRGGSFAKLSRANQTMGKLLHQGRLRPPVDENSSVALSAIVQQIQILEERASSTLKKSVACARASLNSIGLDVAARWMDERRALWGTPIRSQRRDSDQGLIPR